MTMRKNIHLIICIALNFTIATMLSCTDGDVTSAIVQNSDEAKTNDTKEYMSFCATMECNSEANTRTSLYDSYRIIWNKGDAISIFDNRCNNKFLLNGEAGRTYATFTGQAEPTDDKTYYAVYPYQYYANINNGNITDITVPDEQVAIEGSFDPQASIMTATSKNGNDMAFKNLCAYARITLKESFRSITIQSGRQDATGNEYIAGDINITLNDDGTVKTMELPTSKNGYSDVSLIPDLDNNHISYQAGTYYICLIPQTLHGITVTCITSNGNIYKRSIPAETEITNFSQRNTIIDLGTVSEGSGWALEPTEEIKGKTDINGTTYDKGVLGTTADAVDLGVRLTIDGIKCKVLWATHNLGATTPEEAGAYIAWGETGTSKEHYSNNYKRSEETDYQQESYTEDNYSIEAATKYARTNAKLDLCDDAAYTNWGSEWSTPTLEAWNALNKQCNIIDTSDGVIVKKKDSSAFIYLPKASCQGNTTNNGLGMYMTNMLHTKSLAKICEFSNARLSVGQAYERYYGYTVRPVKVVPLTEGEE